MDFEMSSATLLNLEVPASLSETDELENWSYAQWFWENWEIRATLVWEWRCDLEMSSAIRGSWIGASLSGTAETGELKLRSAIMMIGELKLCSASLIDLEMRATLGVMKLGIRDVFGDPVELASLS